MKGKWRECGECEKSKEGGKEESEKVERGSMGVN